MVAASELPINSSASALDMANTIFGDGVTVVGASFTGSGIASGIYTNGDAISPNVTPGDTGVILSTGRATDFTNSSGDANQDNNTTTNNSGVNNNAAFDSIAGGPTRDASWIDVDFIPTGDVMTMQFVFSSEEYPEYVNSIYNDAVGVWINGQEVPLSVADGDTAASVGSVSGVNNTNLYVDNTDSDYNTEMDGFTVTMTLTIPVNSGEVNSIRIGIADVADSSYDSNLLIAGDSVQTTLVAQDDSIEMWANGSQSLDVLANDVNNTSGTLEITHINGQAVTVGSSVTLSTGQTVTLNADGTLQIDTDGDFEEVSFTYGTASVDGAGNVLQNDVGFVTVDTIPCFVAGTMIQTPNGEVAVDALQPGDLVMTYDDGAQPIRWIGQREVAAVGNFAPIKIKAGTFGDHRTLLLSPQHRVLVRDSLAELLFGEREVLVAAKDLVNDNSVVRMEGGEVEYVHILFDKHQVVFSEGLATESFLPGPQTTSAFEQEIVEEICAIFPELDVLTGEGYSPAARRTLKHFEARVLFPLQEKAA